MPAYARLLTAAAVWIGGCAVVTAALAVFHVLGLFVLGGFFALAQLLGFHIYRPRMVPANRWFGAGLFGGFLGGMLAFLPLYEGTYRLTMGRPDATSIGLVVGVSAGWFALIGFMQWLILRDVVHYAAAWIIATAAAGGVAFGSVLVVSSMQGFAGDLIELVIHGALAGIVYGSITFATGAWLVARQPRMDMAPPSWGRINP